MIDARNFKLQFTAVSSFGNRESPVQIKLNDGTVIDIEHEGGVTWDEETGTVYINGVFQPPPVIDPPVDPDA